MFPLAEKSFPVGLSIQNRYAPMKQSISSFQNQLACQSERIKREELEHIALHAHKRAIEARQAANISSVRTSYNLGGWKSLFEEVCAATL